MFKRSLVSRDRAGKASRSHHRRSFKEHPVKKTSMSMKAPPSQKLDSPPLGSSTLMSSIVTITVGAEQRLFAAHEDVLSLSPFFATALRAQFLEANAKRVDLPDDEPEIFSCVLEYLYKGDYYPRLLHNKRRNTWELEDAPASAPATPVHSPSTNNHHHHHHHHSPGGLSASAIYYHSGTGGTLLKDTVVYCAAERFGLEELKRLALRKQGLQSGIEVGTVLRSARYAYDHTPDTDSRLRAHYLALIIRCRKIFKRSGTMQMEMEMGGKLFFDLFVSLCNHVDDIYEIANKQSPRFI